MIIVNINEIITIMKIIDFNKKLILSSIYGE